MGAAIHLHPERAHPMRDRRALLQGVLLGTTYGVLLRGFLTLGQFVTDHIKAHPGPGSERYQWWLEHLPAILGTSGVMTVAFLILGPFCLGFLTVRRLTATRSHSQLTWVFAPWLAVIAMMVIIGLFAWEGAICVVMALPLTLAFASLGGAIAGYMAQRRQLRSNQIACFALLPFLLAPAESLLPAPVQIRTVHNQITIHASPATLWRNIERVPAIAPQELAPTWTHGLGFPRPVEATLSFEGIGGVRHASFERGLVFVETISRWEPEHRLAFSIHADSEHIPTTTLDEHVTIGGRYFDVLDGEYVLQPLDNGNTVLHLMSHERLSTDFNGYAGLWTDAVMSSLQQSILQVIQHRCEQ